MQGHLFYSGTLQPIPHKIHLCAIYASLYLNKTETLNKEICQDYSSLWGKFDIISDEIALQYHAGYSFNTHCFQWTTQPA